ncbi:MAG: thioredoxin [Sphingomicrobium sp.]
MMKSVYTVTILGFAAVGSAVPASAAIVQTFDARTFAIAQRQGRPIVVDVFADWCPTCKAQAPIVDRLAKIDRHKNLIIFRLNYDKQPADWRRLGVRQQSTLIAFRGVKETARSVGDTNAQSLAGLMNSTGG